MLPYCGRRAWRSPLWSSCGFLVGDVVAMRLRTSAAGEPNAKPVCSQRGRRATRLGIVARPVQQIGTSTPMRLAGIKPRHQYESQRYNANVCIKGPCPPFPEHCKTFRAAAEAT